MTVVVLSVTPERLRGVLTRWLLEISIGVYVGHIPARVRDRLWDRIVDDAGQGRALMVWSKRGEQRMDFRVHNHAWEPVDLDGITLMRRTTAESRELARRRRKSSDEHDAQFRKSTKAPLTDIDSYDERVNPAVQRQQQRPRSWSKAGRRRRYGTSVEQQRRSSDERRDPPSSGAQ